MKIVAGLGRLEDFRAYADSGADEVFCGYAPWEWLEKYGVKSPVNRRETLLSPVNLGCLEDMRLLRDEALDRGVDISVTLNSTCYAPEQYDLLLHMAESLCREGIYRFIVADPALMLRLRDLPGAQMQISGEFGEYSPAAMEMLAAWGAARYIFHRKVPLSDMESCMAAVPGREYEAFILNERCHYTGAMCHCLHGDEVGPLCRIPWQIGGVESPLSLPREPEDRDVSLLGGSGCGLCTLPALRKIGITHIKVVGRGNRPEAMCRDIRAVRRALDILETGENDYLRRMKTDLYPDGCPRACYYP